MNGRRLFDEITALSAEPAILENMGQAARSLARPAAAKRAADILESICNN